MGCGSKAENVCIQWMREGMASIRFGHYNVNMSALVHKHVTYVLMCSANFALFQVRKSGSC